MNKTAINRNKQGEKMTLSECLFLGYLKRKKKPPNNIFFIQLKYSKNECQIKENKVLFENLNRQVNR